MQPFVMDLKKIRLLPEGAKPQIALIREEDGFFLNRKRYDDFRLRAEVYALLLKAKEHLPDGVFFMIYEAYRAKKVQEALWARRQKIVREEHPELSEAEQILICETFTANPYDGIGSGHMAACAVDITLCTKDGVELDMGTAMHETNEKTETKATGLSQTAQKNRALLCGALESVGFANYPPEWWHYSYGDHQWAWLTGRTEAPFGIVDLPT